MTASTSPVRCDYCGAEPLACCRDGSDLPCPDHAYRRQRAREMGPGSRRREARADVVARIELGGECAQERLARLYARPGDGTTLDAWRVRVACACLARVDPRRGEVVACELLAAYAAPLDVLTARPREVEAYTRPLGLGATRERSIRDASVDAFRGQLVARDLSRYARDAVALCVRRDASIEEPTDWALAAVWRRLRGPALGDRDGDHRTATDLVNDGGAPRVGPA